MAFSRRLGVIGMVGASWLLAVACDDSNDTVTPIGVAGEGGEAPTAGKSAAAGSQSTAGKGNGGDAGKTGSAGNGGKAGGGGTTSDAGQGGSGETAGAGAGGEAPSTAGAGGATGGAGGAAGAGGEGGAPEPVAAAPHCSYTCASDDDCLIDGDDTIKCNLTTHSCEDPSEACTADSDCLVNLSSWFKPCVDDTQCTANTEACVDAGGQGFCATKPAAQAPACSGTSVSKTLNRFGAQGPVAVCAHPDARCFNRVCRAGCAAPNAGCALGNGDTCSAVTGLCECSAGSECTGTGVCGRDKHCQECEIDDDCAANAPDTKCVGGKCGCPSADACLDFGYQSAPAACQ